MATLQPGEAARMYALAGVARAGATRAGYVSSQVFIRYGGAHVGYGRDDPAVGVLIGSLSIQSELDETPDTCRFTVNGAVVSEGDEVVIALGSKNATTPLFAGFGLTVTQLYVGDKPANIQSAVSAVDYTWQLGFVLVTGQYRTQSASAIVRDLVSRFAGANGFTANAVEANLPIVDEITFTNEDLPTAITRTMRRVGGYWYCDYRRDVHAFFTETGSGPPEQLTPEHRSLADVTRAVERSQALTRVYVEGRGSRLISNVTIGDTMIPLDAVDMFAVASDVFLKAAFQGSEGGAQHLNFSGVAPTTGGSLVGIGQAPPGAPTLAGTTYAGSAVNPGTHYYAYTFVTAAGETLPSPIGTITIGALAAPPTAAPTLQGINAAGNLTGGVHQWAYTFASVGGGETTPSPATAGTSTAQPVATTGGIEWSQMWQGGVLGPPGSRYHYWVTWIGSAGGESTKASAGTEVTVDSYGNNKPEIFIGNGTQSRPWAAIPYGVVQCKVYRTHGTTDWGADLNNAPHYLVTTLNVLGVGSAYPSCSFQDVVPQGSLGPAMPTVNTAMAYAGIMRVFVPVGGTGVTGRKLYRTAAGQSALKLVTSFDNAAAYVDDSVADGSLGAAPPSTNTAGAEITAVTVSNVATGPAAVTSRKIYRSIAGQTQLKFLITMTDNATTAFIDVQGDHTLGADAPTGDSSNLQLVQGQVGAGATTIPVANVGVFAAAGGWAVIGNGEQIVRYAGKTTSAITGIPATGIGSIGAAIVYNSTITTAPMLTGIPSSGARSIYRALTAGDEIYLVVQVDDTAGQTALAADVGGTGIREEWVQDRRLSIAEARARGSATLAIRPLDVATLTYTARDTRTAVGKMVTANLPAPTNIQGDYRIQALTIANFRPHANQYPTYTVTASSSRFSFDDWLRRLRARE